jgi:hypothetical protein
MRKKWRPEAILEKKTKCYVPSIFSEPTKGAAAENYWRD